MSDPLVELILPYLNIFASPVLSNVLNIITIYLLFILIRAFRKYIDKTVVLKATRDTASLLGLFTKFLNDEKRIISLNREFIQMALKNGWITREELKKMILEEVTPMIVELIMNEITGKGGGKSAG